ncbi:13421_t:CDS:2 [Cetraspora pellucida]|uniref:13421_t:CDS:1 n=1 Tax=Cetraspora pellucida TaxID=1433469 RepID=A0A9N9AC56_9GLOM|nr:13421_t:CDS:2 [Cetraspora pellucida]
MIKQVQDNIARIDELHSRSLGTVNEDEATKRNLESLTENTRNILVQTKDKIRKLEALNLGLPPNTGDLAVRRAQTANLRQRFLETLQKYQNIEYQNRQKYRARMERQYKIVKPQATQEEIDAALENDESGQFFAQSLLNSTRYGAAKDALREVQERHDDIKKIEKTIAELVNLFQEMQMLVEAQDAPIATVEEHATQVSKDLESGVQQVEKALESAKGARKFISISSRIKSAVTIIQIIPIILIRISQKVVTSPQHNAEQLDTLVVDIVKNIHPAGKMAKTLSGHIIKNSFFRILFIL